MYNKPVKASRSLKPPTIFTGRNWLVIKNCHLKKTSVFVKCWCKRETYFMIDHRKQYFISGVATSKTMIFYDHEWNKFKSFTKVSSIFCGQHKYYPSPGWVYVLTLHEDREEDERAHIAVGGDEIVHDVTVVLHRLLKQTQAYLRLDND